MFVEFIQTWTCIIATFISSMVAVWVLVRFRREQPITEIGALIMLTVGII